MSDTAWTTRSLEERDLPQIASMAWDFGAEGDAAPVLTRKEFESSYREWGEGALRSAAYRGLVAVSRDRVVGFLWLAIVPRVPKPRATTRWTVDVQSVYVAPDSRRRGIGTALITAARQTSDANVERLVAHTRRSALPAFRAWGFEPDELLIHRQP